MQPKPILYSLSPIDPAGHRFEATVTIAQPNPKGQVVSLPAWIPGSYLIRDFARQIETIQARSGKQQISLTKIDNHSWRAQPCKGPLLITLRIYAWDLSVRGAHLDETHGFVNGTSVFLQVKGQEDAPCVISLLPAAKSTNHWKVFTSLAVASKRAVTRKKSSESQGFTRYSAANYDALIDHPIEMGTPKASTFKAYGAEHQLIFTGVTPNLDLEKITADVKKICEAQIRFFEPQTCQAAFLDTATKYVFLTTVVGDGYGGLEHRASTALMVSRKDLPTIGQAKPPAGYETFLGLVSHEYFHTWHVKRIKPAAFTPYDLSRENHTRLLWIFEGFTSYYDDLMLFRSGIVSKDDYLRLLSKQISAVCASPGRLKQSVAQSSFDAWTRYYKQDENSPNAIVSYYSKGAIIALGLDLKIRKETNNSRSLDDVMRLLWARYGKDFYRSRPQGLDENSFPKLVFEATDVRVENEIQRWAYDTHDVELALLLKPQGISLAWTQASLTPSMDARMRKQGDQLIFSTVFEQGAAHRAGISAHDVLVAIDGLRPDATLAGLDSLLNQYKVGEQVTVHIFRRDELRSFILTLAPATASECKLTDVSKANSNA